MPTWNSAPRLAGSTFAAMLLLVAAPLEADVLPGNATGDFIFLQSRAKQPIVVRVLKPGNAPCGQPVTLTFGNRVRVPACGPQAVIGLNDGVEDTFTPVRAPGVYEVYPSAGRWKVRGADAQ
jgi:hypothetical protein